MFRRRYLSNLAVTAPMQCACGQKKCGPVSRAASCAFLLPKGYSEVPVPTTMEIVAPFLAVPLLGSWLMTRPSSPSS